MSLRNTDILLIEDHEIDRELAIRALEEYNHEYLITAAKDGREARKLLSEMKAKISVDEIPKLILLDLNLPLVSGFDILRQIKENSVTQSIPVVVMTSSRDNTDLQECYRLGANSYIIKPMDITQYTQAIKQVGAYWLLVNQQKD